MRILLIEDYAPLAKNISAYLGEAGYIIDKSDTGGEGLWYAETHAYDIIILDIMLPGLDGLSIVEQLREKGGDTPVILISALESVDKRIEGLELGADDYLVKPFELKELLARIRALTRRHYNRQTKVIINDLEINLNAKRVYRAGEEINLTSREWGLLEYLSYRQGEIVTRQEIWNHVYEDYEGGTSNAVDVTIGYLRKKLNRNNKPNLITTHRGKGYSLDEESQ